MRRSLRISLASIGALVLCLPAVASAATPVSQSFTTPGEQPFVVPAGVTSVQVTLVGGNGGPGSSGISGGIGATASATLAVRPGEPLYAEVAANGESASGEHNNGGYGGGGGGGTQFFLFASAPAGGGGGGASDVRTCPASATPPECGGRQSLASRLIVVGGGGGGGGHGADPPSTAGGSGGAADQAGSAGARDANNDSGGSGGLRGSASAGGAAGAPSSGCDPMSGAGCPGKGELGVGGIGGNSGASGGGGGGGGIFGGGGGGGGEFANAGTAQNPILANGGGGGGGGGSSGVPPGAAGVSGFSLIPTAEGAQPSIAFTWTPAPPAVVTGRPSTVTTTTATLAGTVNPDAWQVTTCSFDISPAASGVASVPCAQQLGGGSEPLPVSATAAGLAPHTTYTVTLTAASVQGSSSGAAVTFTTGPSSSTCECASPTNGRGPAVSALKLSPTRFRRGKHAAKLAGRAGHRRPTAPSGTTISFGLSAPATVTLSFQRAQPGQLASPGHHCLAPSPKRHHPHRCIRYTPAPGAITLQAPAGASRVRFEGILDSARPLSSGSYQLTLSASNAAGHTTASQRPTFTLESG
jgi:hypothetical protein